MIRWTRVMMALAMVTAAGCRNEPAADEPRPTAVAAAPSPPPAPPAPAPALVWFHDEAAAAAEAERTGKGIMVHVVAAWAMPTKELTELFGRPDVAPALADWVPLQLDVTDGDDADVATQRLYGAETLPMVIFISDAVERGRIDRVLPPAELITAIPRRR